MQILTPYPQTALRQELLEAGLIVNQHDYRSYNGFLSNIRTKYLSCKELEELKSNQVFWGGCNPVALLRNYFVRNHLRYFLKYVYKYVALFFHYRSISGRDPRQPLDL